MEANARQTRVARFPVPRATQPRGVYVYWPAANYTRQPINHGSLTQCSFIFTDDAVRGARAVAHGHAFPPSLSLSLLLKARPRSALVGPVLVSRVRHSRFSSFLSSAEVAQREAKEANDRGTVTEGCLPQSERRGGPPRRATPRRGGRAIVRVNERQKARRASHVRARS